MIAPMKLQLALDFPSLAEALALLDRVADLVDIVEAGTPLILKEGIRAVAEIKKRYPRATVLADLKIMDAGELEAGIGFDAGADIVTVLGASETVTVDRACAAARAASSVGSAPRQVMVDLIAVPDVARRAAELAAARPDYLCCHAAYDVQGRGGDPLADLARLRGASAAGAFQARLAVAGGITAARVPALLPYQPEVVVVGGAVSRAPDPRAAALAIRVALNFS